MPYTEQFAIQSFFLPVQFVSQSLNFRFQFQVCSPVLDFEKTGEIFLSRSFLVKFSDLARCTRRPKVGVTPRRKHCLNFRRIDAASFLTPPVLNSSNGRRTFPEVAHENHGACEAGNLPCCREKESRSNKTSSAASAGRGSAVGTGPLLGTGQRGRTRTRKAERKEPGRVENPS